MSLTEAIDPEVESGPAPRRVLLVWDAPNLDMGLGSILNIPIAYDGVCVGTMNSVRAPGIATPVVSVS